MMRRLLVLLLVLFVCGEAAAVSAGFAQQSSERKAEQSSEKRAQRTERRAAAAKQRKRKKAVRAQQRRARRPQREFTSRISTHSEELAFLYGKQVIVETGYNPSITVRLGLYQHGVTVIEFPAGDEGYKIHPADETLVTVDCGPRTEEARCSASPRDSIVLRPAEGFTANGKPTVVTVQRKSGFTVSFVLVPVKSISLHAFNVAVRYSPAKMRQRRRELGLEVYDSQEQSAKRDEPAENETAEESLANAGLEEEKKKSQPSQISKEEENDNRQSKAEGDMREEIRRIAVDMMMKHAAFDTPGMHFLERRIRQDAVFFDLIAFRPTEEIIIGEIDSLYLETLAAATKRNKEESVQNIERLRTVVVTNISGKILQPGKTYFIVYVYEVPVVLSTQRVVAEIQSRINPERRRWRVKLL